MNSSSCNKSRDGGTQCFRLEERQKKKKQKKKSNKAFNDAILRTLSHQPHCVPLQAITCVYMKKKRTTQTTTQMAYHPPGIWFVLHSFQGGEMQKPSVYQQSGSQSDMSVELLRGRLSLIPLPAARQPLCAAVANAALARASWGRSGVTLSTGDADSSPLLLLIFSFFQRETCAAPINLPAAAPADVASNRWQLLLCCFFFCLFLPLHLFLFKRKQNDRKSRRGEARRDE